MDLIDIIKNFKGKKIGVIGDFVADEYIFGMTSRVSREAPVLILKHDSSKVVLGGAANTVNNIHTMGGDVVPMGVLGNDDTGNQILSILKEKGIDTSGLIIDETRHTNTKTRIMAGGLHTVKQQMIRIDKEDGCPVSEKTEKGLLDNLVKGLSHLDALIVSDYGCGAITEGIIEKINELGRESEKIINVDTRSNIKKFSSVTIVTPNEPEAEEAVGFEIDSDEDVTCAGQKLLDLGCSENLLITRGKKGMVLFEGDPDARFIPVFGSDEVADVTGAGDTVISALTMALAAGAGFYDAARISNYAGGIVVMKSGTATVTDSELENAIASEKEQNG
ncbi:MAG: bifunctional ADP-heptose synthase [Deltaproteobacteria bacterium]|nr:bifunctional ADP-heptose synthase [Deltaproteobacteria bacterium]